jgi:thioredoxin 2
MPPANAVHVPCASCFTVNRVPRARLGDTPTCGRCKGHLFGAHPPELDPGSFHTFVARSDLPVVVDFWAPWCGPCHTMAPQFEEAARRSAGKALFAKLNTESAQQLATRLGIRAIPTLIAFRSGREVARQSGAMGAPQILNWLSPQLG